MFRTEILMSSMMACLFFVGCSGGGSSGNRLETVPAAGNLTLDGSAFGPCTLDLIPVENQEDGRFRSATGHVSDDGSFVVGTYDDDDGIVPGSYTVQVNVPLESATPAPNVEYFEFTVGEDGNKEISISLKTASGAGSLMSPELKGGGASTDL